MSTHVSGFQAFFQVFLHHFALAKLTNSSIRFNIVLSCNSFEWSSEKKIKADSLDCIESSQYDNHAKKLKG